MVQPSVVLEESWPRVSSPVTATLAVAIELAAFVNHIMSDPAASLRQIFWTVSSAASGTNDVPFQIDTSGTANRQILSRTPRMHPVLRSHLRWGHNLPHIAGPIRKDCAFCQTWPMHLHRRNHFGTGRSFGRISRGSLDFGIFCFQTSVTSGGMPSAYGESEARASCGVRE